MNSFIHSRLCLTDHSPCLNFQTSSMHHKPCSAHHRTCSTQHPPSLDGRSNNVRSLRPCSSHITGNTDRPVHTSFRALQTVSHVVVTFIGRCHSFVDSPSLSLSMSPSLSSFFLFFEIQHHFSGRHLNLRRCSQVFYQHCTTLWLPLRIFIPRMLSGVPLKELPLGRCLIFVSRFFSSIGRKLCCNIL